MGLYIVRRDAWYSERLVWGIAGVVIGTGTLLAVTVHPAWALLILGTGLFSLVTAFTGFCPVSSVLVNAGVPSFLGDRFPSPIPHYRMRTDRWYLERGIYVVVGTTQSLGAVLSILHHPGWLGFTGFVAAMAVGFAWSGFCPVANALWFAGMQPRLAPPSPAARPAVGTPSASGHC